MSPLPEFCVKQIVLDEDDAILVLTDGITDAFNEDHASFGNERLLGRLTERSLLPAAMPESVEHALT